MKLTILSALCALLLAGCGLNSASDALQPTGSSVCHSANYYGSTSCVTGLPRTTYVHGYTKANGTYVAPYYRSKR